VLLLLDCGAESQQGLWNLLVCLTQYVDHFTCNNTAAAAAAEKLQRNTVPKASWASGTFCFASCSTPISSHVTVKQQQQNKP
jgi:hypothetical protein